ncbi:hypothetical protein P3T18_001066 [Paraburkholderia sp. GAS199]|uniref:hypothetical protein n=1 Tax=Paraburkholderia sp. GAS199 TaxID=3035126 RepID=UPI003D19F69B
MLDRLFRKLGYVPASSMRLLPDGAAKSPESPLHQLHADGFDRGRAEMDALCAWHKDGEGFHYAIGRDDWVPLAVAGFYLSENDQCRAWLDEALRARVWVPHAALASWYAANRVALNGLGANVDRSMEAYSAASAPGDERAVVPLVSASEMAELFALAWKRYHLVSPFRKLGNSPAYNMLGMHHSFRLASQTNEHVLDRVVEWLALWLESRGLKVDHQERTVFVPGYEALYFRSDAEYWP